MSVMVSVVICTWNRADLLDQTLTRMRELRVPRGLTWELLVVNNRCTDHTDAVLARHAGSLPLARVFESAPGLSNARNAALRAVTGTLIVWTDDDVLVDVNWLAELAGGAARHPGVAAFGGPIEPWFPVEPDPVLLDAFPPLRYGFCGLDHGAAERELGPGEYVYGANMGFRHSLVGDLRFDSALGRLGSFQLGHEDKDYQDRVRAAGGRIVWLPAARVKHYVEPHRMTSRYLRAFYFGVGVSDVLRDGPPPGRPLLGAPRYLYRLAATRYLQYLAARVRGHRLAALEHLRGYSYQRGVIRGCRERSRGPKVKPVGG
jgi:glucosyl-dolichyl phosphate glucuronosyltransferase